MSPSQEARRARDAGSAVVEFTLVAILVVFLALGVLQVALALHVRNTLLASAHEGARLAALVDRSAADGQQRTLELIQASLGDLPAEVTVVTTNINGAPGVVVQARAPVPLIGLWGVGEMQVQARAYREEPRG